MKPLIVIPAYNEAENIAGVMEELLRVLPDYDYVIVNDGSSDATADICRRRGYRLLDLPINLGLTGAFQTGVRFACERGYDAAIQMDADGQHDPRFIPELVRMMEERNADLVIGSRFLDKRKPRSFRMAGNSLIEWAILLTTGRKLTDPTSGMRLYGSRILRKMAYGVNFSPEPDTVAYFMRSGAKVAEVQVTMRERTAGKSYLTFGRSVRYMIQMGMNILFIQWVRKRSEVL